MWRNRAVPRIKSLQEPETEKQKLSLLRTSRLEQESAETAIEMRTEKREEKSLKAGRWGNRGNLGKCRAPCWLKSDVLGI